MTVPVHTAAPPPELEIAGVRCARQHEPPSVVACAELLASASRERLRLAFVGGGTALGLGNPPLGLDAVVLTRKLDRIVEYAPEDQVIVAEAGVRLGELQALVAREGQWLGVDAPLPARATLGGLVACGAFGPRRMRYGSIRDVLLGVTLVRADGTLAKGGSKVVKNVAGFDLPKVMCGSLGTLGLIAQVTVRLHPLPEASSTVVVRGRTPEEVTALLRAVRQAQLEPSSIVALRSAEGLYEVGTRFEGFASGVERDVERWAQRVRAAKGTPERLSAAEAGEFWDRQEAARTRGELRFRLQALPMDLLRLQASLDAIFRETSEPRFAWHAAVGMGFGCAEVTDAAAALKAVSATRTAALAAGGALVVEAMPARMRGQLDAWGPAPDALPLMRELARRFDPDRRLNPGRFVGGI